MTRPVLVARCANVLEEWGLPCDGELRFGWGMSQAACRVRWGRMHRGWAKSPARCKMHHRVGEEET